MFEHRTEPLLPRAAFVRRMARNAAFATALVFGSLAIGALGYHGFAGLDWVDSLLNASMILFGEGPVDPMRTTGGKLFASAYAMFSGVVFITTVAFLIAPMAHRLLHRFHLETEDGSGRHRKKHHATAPAPPSAGDSSSGPGQIPPDAAR
jgi:hypothetical protein